MAIRNGKKGPRLVAGIPVLPLLFDQNEQIDLVFSGLDPALAEKMAPEWLLEFGEQILHALQKVKKGFIHPESGLYNGFLLQTLLQETTPQPRTLMLMTAMYRTRQAAAVLNKAIHIARLLEASAACPLFYFGGNLFGMIHYDMQKERALLFARRLLGRLKREGLHRMHIGIVVEKADRSKAGGEILTEQCWSALEEAERRGPFSLCEASDLRSRENHPLALPSAAVLRQLRKRWRNLERFGLVLLRVHGSENLPEDIVELVGNLSKFPDMVTAVTATEVYVVLPGLSKNQIEKKGKNLAAAVARRVKPVQVETGIAYWPCLSFSATDTVRNCRKALLHGSFIGPDVVTTFDHVTLNISGDRYFEIGDYRRAIREYRAGLQLKRDDINLLNSLGVTLAELNRNRQVDRGV